MSETWVKRSICERDPLAQPCIHEFEYVFPDDLPPGLSPLRGSEHQFNLLLGSPFQISVHIDVML